MTKVRMRRRPVAVSRRLSAYAAYLLRDVMWEYVMRCDMSW